MAVSKLGLSRKILAKEDAGERESKSLGYLLCLPTYFPEIAECEVSPDTINAGNAGGQRYAFLLWSVRVLSRRFALRGCARYSE
jgi:hypothetical protein